MKKDNLIGLLIAFILMFLIFNILLHSTFFHGFLIKKYSDNQSYLDIDKNITGYITGFSSELNVNFNEKEKSHMKDVRNLVLIEEFIFISLLITFFALLHKRKVKSNHIKKSSLIIFFLGFLCLIAFLFFNIFFKLFHLIFFPQGNWQFSSDSLMIQIYHESFFRNFFVVMVVLSLFLALIIHFIVGIKRKL